MNYSYFSKPPTKRLLFIHIPKTAGTSLVQKLHSVYFDPIRPFERYHFSLVPHATLAGAERSGENVHEFREKISHYAMSIPQYRLVTGHQMFSARFLDAEYADFVKVSGVECLRR